MPNTSNLIPRELLFGHPVKERARISPDGATLSWLEPLDGVLQIWAAPLQHPDDAEPLTRENDPVHDYFWGRGSDRLLYFKDQDGDENWRLYTVELATRRRLLLSPSDGCRATLVGWSDRHPSRVAISLNERDAQWPDLHEVDCVTGAKRMLLKNDREISGYVLDHDLKPRLMSSMNKKEGGVRYFIVGDEELLPFWDVSHEDFYTARPLSFDAEGQHLYCLNSVGRDRAALYSIEWQSGEIEQLAEHPRADICDVVYDPKTLRPHAVAAEYLERDWIPLTDRASRDLAALRKAVQGHFQIVSQTTANDYWIVLSNRSGNAPSYYIYNCISGTIELLFLTRPRLAMFRLKQKSGVEIRARDGLVLPSYLTLPDGRPTEPRPMVLLVHGGPWWRDGAEFDPLHQWLSDRGYAVLSTNFRSSTGFGKSFTNAGDRQWGGAILNDLIDAAMWAVDKGIARRDRLAIMGASFGGYAALAALSLRPGVFCCGIDQVGPVNLETLLSTTPPYWAANYQRLIRRIGDPNTPDGIELLRSHSPIHFASNINVPLLIAQGANDPRVKISESDQISSALEGRQILTYLVFLNEGHFIANLVNRIFLSMIVEKFLSNVLGGYFQSCDEIFDSLNIEFRLGRDLLRLDD